MRASTADFSLKKGDTRPVLAVTFTDANGSAIALRSTATITFRMRKWGSTALAVNSSTRITITSTSGGTVQRTWSTSETGSTGTYFFQFLYVTSTGRRTHPNFEHGTINIHPSLGL
jgi:hypothetical protein